MSKIERNADNLVRGVLIGLREKSNKRCIKRWTKINNMEAFLYINGEQGVVEVTPSMMSKSGLTEELLWDIATINTSDKVATYKNSSLPGMYILSLEETRYGIAAILCKDKLASIYGKGVTLCAVPFTVNALMVMPYSMYMGSKEAIDNYIEQSNKRCDTKILSEPVVFNTSEELMEELPSSKAV